MRTVYLVDDNDGLRTALQDRLESGGYRVHAFDSPDAILKSFKKKKKPSEEACFLLDVYMPSMTGLELADRLHESGADAPFVFMTGFGDVPTAVEAMDKGAVTFLEKPLAMDKLDEALEKAFACRKKANGEKEPALDFAQRAEQLSAREREVIDLIASGMTNKEAGRELNISHRTVEHHRERILTKTGLSNTNELLSAWQEFSAASA